VVLGAFEDTGGDRRKALRFHGGQHERLLIEERNEKNGLLSGRTASSIIVEFPGEDEWIGEFKNVKVTEARNWILRGECVD